MESMVKTTARKHNFSAGPAILPVSVLEKAAQAVIEYEGLGMSLMEMSHRSPQFEKIMEEAEALVRELSGAGDDYSVLFLTGGASTQFFMAPLNLLPQGAKAAYVDTGTWSDKAIKEAKLYGEVAVVASSKAENYNHIPKGYAIPSDAIYLHLTSNNTIFGTQYASFPTTELPIVCDMSSDIFSRPLNANDFGLIYAGAQKNLGPSGVTLVIVKKDLLGKVDRPIPSMLKYQTHADNGSMYNTPPVFPIYVLKLTMEWIKENGGLEGMAVRNQEKASLLYNEIDNNPCFSGTVAKEDRSWMNVCFLPAKEEWTEEFMQMAKAAGISGIKGHRSVGGFRASIYNAMPIESIQALVDVMRAFAQKHA